MISQDQDPKRPLLKSDEAPEQRDEEHGDVEHEEEEEEEESPPPAPVPRPSAVQSECTARDWAELGFLVAWEGYMLLQLLIHWMRYDRYTRPMPDLASDTLVAIHWYMTYLVVWGILALAPPMLYIRRVKGFIDLLTFAAFGFAQIPNLAYYIHALMHLRYYHFREEVFDENTNSTKWIELGTDDLAGAENTRDVFHATVIFLAYSGVAGMIVYAFRRVLVGAVDKCSKRD